MSQKGFAPIVFILLLLVGIGLGSYLIRQKTNLLPKAAESTSQVSLAYKVTSDQGVKDWTTFLYAPTIPAQKYNYVGLSGDLTISGNSNSDAIVLVTIFNTPSSCPATGKIPKDYTYPVGNRMINNFILKLNQPGSATAPINFTLPVKVPLTGCTYLQISGGDPRNGDPITTTSNLTFIYDTEPAVSPAPYFVDLGDEFCTGRPAHRGCFIGTPSINSNQAFATFFKVKEPVKLLSLTGNFGVGGNAIALSNRIYPTGDWNLTADYYVYPNCQTPDGKDYGYFGPSEELAKTPTGAINLLSENIRGNKSVGGMKSVTKYFSDINLAAGDCLVHVQKFSSTSGALASENQILPLVQPISSPSSVPSPSLSPGIVSKPVFSLTKKPGLHFYTISESERDSAQSVYKYTYDGIAFYAFPDNSQDTNLQPVYRISNKNGDRLYTWEAEANRVKNQGGWGDTEGIAFYAYPTAGVNRIPVYRLYNSKIHDHFYVTSEQDKNDVIQKNGYKLDGINFYAPTP